MTLVAESSFQHARWQPGLLPLLDNARVRIVQCSVEAAVARERIVRRADETTSWRAVHGDHSLLEPFDSWKQEFEGFDPIALPVPSISVDTTDGYAPTLEEILAFLNR